jgi:hypothetical protein
LILFIYLCWIAELLIPTRDFFLKKGGTYVAMINRDRTCTGAVVFVKQNNWIAEAACDDGFRYWTPDSHVAGMDLLEKFREVDGLRNLGGRVQGSWVVQPGTADHVRVYVV